MGIECAMRMRNVLLSCGHWFQYIRAFSVNNCHHFQAIAVDVCVDWIAFKTANKEKRVSFAFAFGLLLFSLSLRSDVTMPCFMLLLLLFLLYVFQIISNKWEQKRKNSKLKANSYWQTLQKCSQRQNNLNLDKIKLHALAIQPKSVAF